MTQHLLLQGVVGSTAYGLAGPHSDIDRLGVYAVATEELHGLRSPQESHVTTNPDLTLHEAAKFCRLALKCNPTITELMWLDDYEHIHPTLGMQLIGIRRKFLSAPRVRSAYLGYASDQFTKLKNRGGSSFSADLGHRTAKHARHLARLCNQGYELYATGNLHIRLDDPQGVMEFGELVAQEAQSGVFDTAERLILAAEAMFDSANSPLPQYPNEEKVESWLLSARRAFYTPGGE